MTRLILREFNRATSESDIRELFGKLGNVADVYVPGPTVTGMVRNFAIVRVECSEESAQKTMKALNGSHWKGNRIQIEMAKEYFKDRLKKEAEDAELVELKKQSKVVVATLNEWNEPVISLRLRPNQPCVRVSTVRGAAMEPGVIPLGSNRATPKERSSKHSVTPDVNVLNAPIVVSIPSTAPSSAAQKEAPSGGGKRKGFGTLVSSATSASAEISGKSKVDCCVENDNEVEDELFLSKYMEEEVSEPCITSADLEEEALAKERSRASNMLDLLLGTSDKIESVPSSSSAPPARVAEGDKWQSTIIKRFDPTKVSRSESVAATPAAEVSQQLNYQTVDPAGSFAEMSVLKDIFFKEGGVGWNETKDSIAQRQTGDAATAANCSLFLEAEKYGIDVRGGTDSADQGLSFNFFEDPPDTSAVAASYISTEKASAGDSVGVPATAVGLKRKLLPAVKMSEVVELAYKFCRVSSVDALKSQWEENKEKLILDYKKKVRDSKKKGLAKIETVVVAPAKPIGDKKKPSGGNYSGKGRGGVRHSKKGK